MKKLLLFTLFAFASHSQIAQAGQAKQLSIISPAHDAAAIITAGFCTGATMGLGAAIGHNFKASLSRQSNEPSFTSKVQDAAVSIGIITGTGTLAYQIHRHTVYGYNDQDGIDFLFLWTSSLTAFLGTAVWHDHPEHSRTVLRNITLGTVAGSIIANNIYNIYRGRH